MTRTNREILIEALQGVTPPLLGELEYRMEMDGRETGEVYDLADAFEEAFDMSEDDPRGFRAMFKQCKAIAIKVGYLVKRGPNYSCTNFGGPDCPYIYKKEKYDPICGWESWITHKE